MTKIQPPEISVVIPIYKSAAFLQEALESVLCQSALSERKDHLEVLLIVDGECEDFSGKIPPAIVPILKTLTIEHRGVSGARNYGIEKSAAAKFVAFLDADDIWLPQKIERQLEWMNRYPSAGIVYTNSFWIDKTGRTLARTQREQYGKLPCGKIHGQMLERDYIITSSMLVRKEIFRSAGLFDTKLEVCEDWEFKIRASKVCEIYGIPEPLIYYRLHANGTHYQCKAMLECGYKVFENHVRGALADGENGGRRDLFALKANIPLNLAGSLVYIDQPRPARKFLTEAMRLNWKNKRIYLLWILTLLPKRMRDFLLYIRDRYQFLP